MKGVYQCLTGTGEKKHSAEIEIKYVGDVQKRLNLEQILSSPASACAAPPADNTARYRIITMAFIFIFIFIFMGTKQISGSRL
jgi:hypothetical protein